MVWREEGRIGPAGKMKKRETIKVTVHIIHPLPLMENTAHCCPLVIGELTEM